MIKYKFKRNYLKQLRIKKRASFKRLDFCIIINSQSEDFPFNTLPSPESTQYVPKKKYELPRVSNRLNDSLDLQTAITYP